MSSALALTEQTLDDVIVGALRQSRRRARTADCPVCGGTMRRLAVASPGVELEPHDLVCGDCASVLVDEPPASVGQLRLVELIRRAARPLLRECAGALDATRLHRRRRCAGRPRRAAGSTGSPTRSRRSGRASSRGRRRSTRPCGSACRPTAPRRSPSSRSSGAPASMSRSRRSVPTMICCCRWLRAPRAGSTPSWSTRTPWGTWCRSRRWSRWTARLSPTARRWRRRSPIRRPIRTSITASRWTSRTRASPSAGRSRCPICRGARSSRCPRPIPSR